MLYARVALIFIYSRNNVFHFALGPVFHNKLKMDKNIVKFVQKPSLKVSILKELPASALTAVSQIKMVALMEILPLLTMSLLLSQLSAKLMKFWLMANACVMIPV